MVEPVGSTTVCDALNVHVDLDRDQWKCLASAVFTFMEDAQERAAAQTQRAEAGHGIVSGNWRLVFRFEGGGAVDVDLVDYH